MTSWNNEHREQLSEYASIRFDEPMSRHTSFKVGGTADMYAMPENIEELELLINYCQEYEIEYIVIGGGTNLLVKDTGIRGMVIVLNRLNRIIQDNEDDNGIKVTAMAGAKTAALCRFAIKNGLGGMNFAMGIPGTVGGAIRMNAGTVWGAMGDVLESLTILTKNREKQVISRDQLEIGYRNLAYPERGEFGKEIVILEGCFRLQSADAQVLKDQASEIIKLRHSRQPTHLPSAGCFFKNPGIEKSAGQLIDMAGFKGKSVGGAQVSEKHANFIVNRGGAAADDILKLSEMIQEKIYHLFNVMLEPEVRIVG